MYKASAIHIFLCQISLKNKSGITQLAQLNKIHISNIVHLNGIWAESTIFHSLNSGYASYVVLILYYQH